jgi:ABC-2 type transport system permease protein
MYNVMSLLGEKATNQLLGEFVSSKRFSERPYPTTNDFHSMLMAKLSPEQMELANDQLKRITLYGNRMVTAKGKKRPDGLYEVQMKISLEKKYVDSLGANEKKAPFKGLIQLALLLDQAPQKKSDVLRLESLALKDGQEITWTCREKPVYAALDPFYTFTDIHPEDNHLKIDWE